MTTRFGKTSPTRKVTRRSNLPLAQIRARPVAPADQDGDGDDAGTGPGITITSPPRPPSTRQSVLFGRPPAPSGGPLTLPASQPAPGQAPPKGVVSKGKDWMVLTALGVKTKGKARPAGIERLQVEQDRTRPLDLEALMRDNATLATVSGLVDPEHADKAELVVGALQAAGEPAMSIDDIVRAVNRVGDIYDRIGPGATGPLDRDTRIALDMHETEEARGRLGSMIEATRVEYLPAAQARIAAEFLRDNPSLAAALKAAGVSYKFASGTAASYGEGVLINGVIHIGALDAESPGTFLRMMLHETGHALYQRAVLPPDRFPDGKLPLFWDKGNAPDLYRERERLIDEAEDAGLSPDDPPFAAKIAGIDAELAAGDAEAVWDAMPENTRTLYQAWSWLRTDKGRHLLGLDLGANRRQAERQSYQAETFTEFCAETFMQVATGDINAHIVKIMDDDTVPAEIKEAWMDSVRVLDTYAEQRILGRPTAFDRT